METVLYVYTRAGRLAVPTDTRCSFARREIPWTDPVPVPVLTFSSPQAPPTPHFGKYFIIFLKFKGLNSKKQEVLIRLQKSNIITSKIKDRVGGDDGHAQCILDLHGPS